MPFVLTGSKDQADIYACCVQRVKGPHEAFIFLICTFMGCIFLLFLYFSLSRHCLDSMSKRLGKIISNAFTVRVDKHFDACKHIELTMFII